MVYIQHRRTNCGRRSVTHFDNVIKSFSKDYPFHSLRSIRSHLQISTGTIHGAIPSISTISRRLIKAGRPSRSPARKCKLIESKKLARYLWAMDHLEWEEEWNNVIFTDESTIQINNNPLRHVRRPKGKRFSAKYVVFKENRSVGSLNVWAAALEVCRNKTE